MTDLVTTISDERLAEMIIAAYRRGHAWRLENPGSEEYLAKAAYDYADKALSSLEASPAPVSEERIPNAVLDAVARELQMTWGVGVENPKPKPIGFRSTWREIARPVARAALAAKGGQ